MATDLPIRATRTDLIVRATRTGDIARFLPRARIAERKEAWAATGMPFERALARSLAFSSRSWTAVDGDGAPVALYGVAPIPALTGLGVPWLVATDALPRHRRAFIAQCRDGLDQVLRLYPHLINYVDARNRTAIRWLRWLGFRLDPAEPFGPFGVPFHRFEMES